MKSMGNALETARAYYGNRQKPTVFLWPARGSMHWIEYLERSGYEVTDKGAYDAIVYYLAHRHELRKGLYVFSRVNGVGKTFILDLIRDHDNAERKAMLSNRFTKKFVCEELVNINYDEDRSRRKEIKRTGLNWDDRYRHFYFDDLGKEVPTRYDRQELMGLIIGNLHRSFANRKLNLISSFTSNLHPEDREFVERYGAHVASRINEMCVVIEIKGEDQRR